MGPVRYAPTAYICGEHEIAVVVSLVAQCILVEAARMLVQHIEFYINSRTLACHIFSSPSGVCG